MAYEFYLAGTLLPVTPSKLKVKIDNNNKSVNLINEGDVNILKKPGLTQISFTALLPNQSYHFARGSAAASSYLSLLENLKVSKEPFSFTVTRQLSNSRLNGTSMLVSLEEYTINEDAESYGIDYSVDITLKQYKAYGTRNVRIAQQKAAAETVRATDTASKPSGTQYTVKSGDNLTTIAQKYYNSADSWREIYNANTDTIGANPNKIYPGQVLTLPQQE